MVMSTCSSSLIKTYNRLHGNFDRRRLTLFIPTSAAVHLDLDSLAQPIPGARTVQTSAKRTPFVKFLLLVGIRTCSRPSELSPSRYTYESSRVNGRISAFSFVCLQYASGRGNVGIEGVSSVNTGLSTSGARMRLPGVDNEELVKTTRP